MNLLILLKTRNTNRITHNLHFRISRRQIILRTQISYKYWKKHHVAIEQALTYSCTSLPLESRGGGWRALRAYEKEGRDVENVVQEQTRSFLKRKSPTHVPDLCLWSRIRQALSPVSAPSPIHSS